MLPESLKLLHDIETAGQYAFDFTAGIDFDTYESSPLIRSATERQLEIIGEALNRLKRADMELWSRISDNTRIIAFRNVLAHGYDIVRNDTVWEVVEFHLPVLMKEVAGLKLEAENKTGDGNPDD